MLAREIPRKSLHLLVGLLCAGAPWFLSHTTLFIILSVGILGATLLQYNTLLVRLFGADRGGAGAPFFLVGIGITAWLTLPDERIAYAFGVLVLTLSDAAAALIGKALGTTTLLAGNHPRTAEGSLAFFCTTLLLLIAFPTDANAMTILFVALLLTQVEFIATHSLDNIAVPVASAILFMLLL